MLVRLIELIRVSGQRTIATDRLVGYDFLLVFYTSLVYRVGQKSCTFFDAPYICGTVQVKRCGFHQKVPYWSDCSFSAHKSNCRWKCEILSQVFTARHCDSAAYAVVLCSSVSLRVRCISRQPCCIIIIIIIIIIIDIFRVAKQWKLLQGPLFWRGDND